MVGRSVCDKAVRYCTEIGWSVVSDEEEEVVLKTSGSVMGGSHLWYIHECTCSFSSGLLTGCFDLLGLILICLFLLIISTCIYM